MIERVISPLQISEQLLERTGTAIMTGDFDTFAECFTFPQIIATFDGSRSVDSREELFDLFTRMREHFASTGVTEMIRNCVVASFDGPDRIMTTHVTRLISKAQLTQEPYPVFSEIVRVDNRWKITRSDYAIADSPTQSEVLAGRSIRIRIDS